jgi:hypothetical protein
MAKKKSLLDELSETTKAMNYKHGGGTWFDRLPDDVKEELADVRKAVNEGKVYGPRRVIARAVLQLCKDRGLQVCGLQGVETWLRGGR